jgi:indolepyruvate decarboxylase
MFCARVDLPIPFGPTRIALVARGTGAYIEVVTDKYAASPLAKKYHESIETLYAA